MINMLKNKFFIVSSILVTTLILDQWTKVWAVNKLKDTPAIEFLNGIFQLVYAENPGAFLGMGGTWSSTTRFIIFGVIVVIGLTAMLWSMIKNKLTTAELYAYSFILAGGIGNVIDRLTHENGHVVDFLFIDLKFSAFARTGVFNVADMAIVLGVLIIFIPSLVESLKSMTLSKTESQTEL
jgi:signal peptidase II